MQSFSTEAGSCRYHIYRGSSWTNLVIHQSVQVAIETNAISEAYDPYFCKMTVTWRDRINAITVGHTPRELSQFVYYFLQEGGSVKGTAASIQYRVSPTTEVGLEIPIQMTFSHTSKPIVEKMKLVVESQLVKMDQMFSLEDDEENPDDDDKTKDGQGDDDGEDGDGDDGDEGLIQGGGNSGEAGTSMGPVAIVIDGEQQIVAESEQEIQETVQRE